MQHRYVALILFACTFATVSPLRTTAATLPPVILSEINWGGSPLSTADEWIELANTTTQNLDISAWRIVGASSPDSPLVIPASTMLSPGETYVIANYADTDVKSVLNFAPDLVSSSVSIPNTSLAITLYDPTGVIVDTYIDTGTPEFGSSSLHASMERSLVTGAWESAQHALHVDSAEMLGSPGALSASSATHEAQPSPESYPPLPPCSPLPSSPQEIPETTSTDEQSISEEEHAEPPQESSDSETSPEITLIAPVTQESVTDAQNSSPSSPVSEVPTDVETPHTETEAEDSEDEADTQTEAPLRTVDYHSLRITEFVSDPLDGKEFIELFNAGREALPLEDVHIADASGKRTSLSGEIAAGAYLVIENPLGKLNNDGDALVLLLPDDQTLFTLSYGTNTFPAPKKGFSAGVCAGVWMTTLSPSPGQENICSSPSLSYETSETSTPAIDRGSTSSGTSSSVQGNVSSAETESTDVTDVAPAQSVVVTHAAYTAPGSSHMESQSGSSSAKKKTSKSAPVETTLDALETLSSGQVVEVTGTLIATPGMLGKRVAYLDGVQLYFHKATWPDLSLGDQVRITGTWDYQEGVRRIKISDAENITVLGNAPLTPRAWEDIPQDERGDILASANGTLLRKDGDAFIFSLQSTQAEIVVVDLWKTGALSLLRTGDTVSLTGIRLPHDGRIILVPRSADDVVKTSPPSLHEEASEHASGILTSSTPPSPAPLIGGGILMSSVGALGYWFIRSKKYSFLFSS
ncbi:lamin tail domain-containing protein [bacterium]|nr:lamin tail domain-containing protein [bacterium]